MMVAALDGCMHDVACNRHASHESPFPIRHSFACRVADGWRAGGGLFFATSFVVCY